MNDAIDEEYDQIKNVKEIQTSSKTPQTPL